MFVEYYIIEFSFQVYKKNVDYFIYNYFLYIHKLSSNRDSNRKPNRTATLCLVGLSMIWIGLQFFQTDVIGLD